MASFARRKRHATRKPQIRVNGDLEPGSYVFELRIKDDSGNVSAPARIKVTVVRRVFGGGLPRGGIITGRDLLDGRLTGSLRRSPPGGRRRRGG